MGIVVTIIMLLGLSMVWPVPLLHRLLQRNTIASANLIALLLLLAGLWNSLWFGVQHITMFWGVAALVSGVLMVLLSVLVAIAHGSEFWKVRPVLLVCSKMQPIALWIKSGLLVCFLLYAVTLIQLNLGMSILQ